MQTARDPERPKFTMKEAEMIAGNLFELSGGISKIEELPSERDQNFHKPKSRISSNAYTAFIQD